MAEGERVAVIDTKLLELIACPISKGPLVYDAARSELVSKSARLAYPVRDGIPIMLPSEARSLRDDPPER
ncbi:Trm112 family protein [Aquibium microcysteis]|uniref:Trm112 family protein n=1 Tax=Aquibium microcysteis TaxID=675281 RepID=UPI00165D2322|nr:Trm112 family protein [Aquibium microcysteis]